MKFFFSFLDPSASLYIRRIIRYIDGEVISIGYTGKGRCLVNETANMSYIGMPSITKIFPLFIKSLRAIKSVDIAVFCDSPDFNIPLGMIAKSMKEKIKNVYFIPPTVWAWRKERKKVVERYFDRVLYILPFEKSIWEEGIYVGHPICQIIKEEIKGRKTMGKIGCKNSGNKNNKNKGNRCKKLIAFLPGSRLSEVRNHIDLFKEIGRICSEEGIRVIIPTSHAEMFTGFANSPDFADFADFAVVPAELSRWAMMISDGVICASGTASLESALLGKPTVIFYNLPQSIFEIAKRLVDVKFISLPNLILNREVYPELIQDKATARNLIDKLDELLSKRINFKSVARELFEKLDVMSFSEIAQKIMDIK